MLNATAIEIHVHPMVGDRLLKGCFVIECIRVAEEIPRGINERVHGVGFTAGGFPTLGTVHVKEGLGRCQWVALAEHHIAWKFHGEVLFWNGNRAAIIAVNHRNGGAPVALP